MRVRDIASLSAVARAAALVAAAAAGLASPAHADKIKHPTAVFAGLDKITGGIISFEVAIDETVQFGALQVTPRICYTRPLTEAPLTDAFVEVDDVGSGAANDYKRIFGGWMFSASPGLHAVEDPVYDVWLTDCKGGKDVIKTPAEVASAPAPGFDEPLRQPKPGTQPRPRRETPPGTPGAQGGTVASSLPPPAPAQPRQPSRSFFPTSIFGGGGAGGRSAPDIARESGR